MKRRCPCCTDFFALNVGNFHRASREAMGFDYYCKGCRRVINRTGNREWMARNRKRLGVLKTVAAAT
jgi:hypothetical protein